LPIGSSAAGAGEGAVAGGGAALGAGAEGVCACAGWVCASLVRPRAAFDVAAGPSVSKGDGIALAGCVPATSQHINNAANENCCLVTIENAPDFSRD
jgi:hypothetical protein